LRGVHNLETFDPDQKDEGCRELIDRIFALNQENNMKDDSQAHHRYGTVSLRIDLINRSDFGDD
jgi:hypothetical protein